MNFFRWYNFSNINRVHYRTPNPMKKFTAYFVLGLLAAFCVFGTVYPQSVPAQWVRVESENKEFSCLLPAGFSVALDKEGFSRSSPRDLWDHVDYKNVRSLSGFSDGIAVFLEVYDVKGTKKGLAFITESISDVSIIQMQFENFTIRQVKRESDDTSNSFYIASKSQIYLVGYGSRERNSPSTARFLASIRLNGKPIFNSKIAPFPESSSVSSLSALSETTEIVEQLIYKQDEKELKQKATQPASMPQPNGPKSPGDGPLTILLRPRAAYTDSARHANEQGTIRLKIMFLANGHIGKITVLKKLRYGLLENAIRSAKRIKFIPAAKDGVPIDKEQIVEYSFSIY